MENYFDTPDTLSTSSILALFETNKEQRQTFVDDIMQRLEEGQADPLVVKLQVKCIEDILCQLTETDVRKNKRAELAKRFKELVMDAANHYPGKSFDFHNATFSKAETGTRYDYTVCQDTEWELLDSQIKGLTEQKSKREKFLQTVPAEGIIVTDPLTGETVTIYPPAKSSTSSITVKLK